MNNVYQVFYTHLENQSRGRVNVFFPHRLTTTFIQIGKIRPFFFAVEDYSDKINDDIYQTGCNSAVFQFTTIGYAFFFTLPPFVSGQIIKCGAKGKVTQQYQKKKEDTHIIG
jgi:hypothetical protein